MKKAEQLEINQKLETAWWDAMWAWAASKNQTETRLRTCSARVVTIDGYRFLYSYNTPVACIRFSDGLGIDMLRNVYGYTATSAQHISKFFRDYNTTDIQTWRSVS